MTESKENVSVQKHQEILNGHGKKYNKDYIFKKI